MGTALTPRSPTFDVDQIILIPRKNILTWTTHSTGRCSLHPYNDPGSEVQLVVGGEGVKDLYEQLHGTPSPLLEKLSAPLQTEIDRLTFDYDNLRARCDEALAMNKALEDEVKDLEGEIAVLKERNKIDAAAALTAQQVSINLTNNNNPPSPLPSRWAGVHTARNLI